MAYIKTLNEQELVGGNSNTKVYPRTTTQAVYSQDGDGNVPEGVEPLLEDRLQGIETRVDRAGIGTVIKTSTGRLATTEGTNNENGKASAFVVGSGNTVNTHYDIPRYGAIIFGDNCFAGTNDAVFGTNNHALSANSLVGGSYCITSDDASHSIVWGTFNRVLGMYSLVTGHRNTAEGDCSIIGGYNNTGTNDGTFIHGSDLVTNNEYEVAFGTCNSSDSYTVFTIGGGTGTSASQRSNLFEVLRNGDIYIWLNGDRVLLQDCLNTPSGTSTAYGMIPIANVNALRAAEASYVDAINSEEDATPEDADLSDASFSKVVVNVTDSASVPGGIIYRVVTDETNVFDTLENTPVDSSPVVEAQVDIRGELVTIQVPVIQNSDGIFIGSRVTGGGNIVKVAISEIGQTIFYKEKKQEDDKNYLGVFIGSWD